MADLGTAIAQPEPVMSTGSNFALGAGLSLGTAVLAGGSTSASTVPTAGQIWPRGNPYQSP